MSRAVRYAGTWRLVDGEVSLLREGSGDIVAESNSLYLAGCNWKQNNGPTTGSLLLVVVEKVILHVRPHAHYLWCIRPTSSLWLIVTHLSD